MRRSRLLAAVLTMGLASGSLCYAGIFISPQGDAPDPAADSGTSSRLRVAVCATAWNLPKVDVSRATGFAGDRVHFKAGVVPMVVAEGRLTPRLSVGGWYNPLGTDIYLEGPTADLMLAGPTPALPSPRVAKADLKMWNAHASYRLPGSVTLQAGLLRYHGSLSLTARNPRQIGPLQINAEMESTEAQLWGYRTWSIWPDVPGPTYFTGGLGVRHRLTDAGSAPGPKTAVEASATLSYFVSDRLSVDLGGWFTDLTNRKTFTSRFSAGVSGQF